MYLVKFFYCLYGGDGCEFLLILGEDFMVIGIYMDWKGDCVEDEFLCQMFLIIVDVILVFCYYVVELVVVGYVEIIYIDYMLCSLLFDLLVKLDWQKGLDELMFLLFYVLMVEQVRQFDVFSGMLVEYELFYFWYVVCCDYVVYVDVVLVVCVVEWVCDMLFVWCVVG